MQLTRVAIAACIGMMFAACQKDQPLSGKNQQGVVKAGEQSEDVIGEFFAQNRENNTQTFVLKSVKQGGEFVGERGTRIKVMPNGLQFPNGEPVNVPVVIRLLETYDRGAMLMNNRVTEAVPDNPDLGGASITTGGAIDLSMKTEDGQTVVPVEGGVRIEFPAQNTGGVDPDMTIWEGVDGQQDRDNAWQDSGESPDVSTGNYRMDWSGWGRCNIDRSVNFGGQLTTLRADLPSGFDDNNAEIFVAFPGMPGMLASMDMYDAVNGNWYEHGNYANVGQTLHFIAVGYSGGQMYAKIQTSTLGVNHFENITGLSVMTPAALSSAINSLP